MSVAQQKRLAIYVSEHCNNCHYAIEVADRIRVQYPAIAVRVVDVEAASDEVPETVFATPMYLLNDHVWSLGNPSDEMIRETFGGL